MVEWISQTDCAYKPTYRVFKNLLLKLEAPRAVDCLIDCHVKHSSVALILNESVKWRETLHCVVDIHETVKYMLHYYIIYYLPLSLLCITSIGDHLTPDSAARRPTSMGDRGWKFRWSPLGEWPEPGTPLFSASWALLPASFLMQHVTGHAENSPRHSSDFWGSIRLSDTTASGHVTSNNVPQCISQHVTVFVYLRCTVSKRLKFRSAL